MGLFAVGCGGSETDGEELSGRTEEAGLIEAASTCQDDCWNQYYTCMRIAHGELEEVNACIEGRMACLQSCP